MQTKFMQGDVVSVNRFRTQSDKHVGRFAIGDTAEVVQGPDSRSRYLIRMHKTGWLLTFASGQLDIAPKTPSL